MSVMGAVEYVQSTLRTLPALEVPIIPPGTVVKFPTANVYEGPGVWSSASADLYFFLFSIIIDMPVPAVDFEAGVKLLRPFLQILPLSLLADSSFNRQVSTFEDISFSGLVILVPESEGLAPLMGYRWTINNIKFSPQ